MSPGIFSASVSSCGKGDRPTTSLCICPVTRVNGMEIGPKGQVWGPVTKRLTDAYQSFVKHDFVAQYLKRYVDGMEARAF